MALNVGPGHAKALRGAGRPRARCRGAAPAGQHVGRLFWRCSLLIAARACPVGLGPKGLTPAGLAFVDQAQYVGHISGRTPTVVGAATHGFN